MTEELSRKMTLSISPPLNRETISLSGINLQKSHLIGKERELNQGNTGLSQNTPSACSRAAALSAATSAPIASQEAAEEAVMET